ncbi:alkaline phosphatase D family protein [Nonomuraea aridisoli]|uniref:Alkaline phosphatase n=1 Tax=Nonomuraea aridisoli TaxID=2070368 RepID=A0A2W2DX21_9ACTN|nr:alkaline phosphatase D family protein [Nonomuraea aridisoli]PZG16446.1 alkaline phosphatase [Nonomuraea aridisoli]
MTDSVQEDEVRRAAQHTRRRFLTVSGAAMALAFGTNLASRATAEAVAVNLRSDPFTLGVASGDPLPTAVVLWTRLAPEIFDPMGGMPDKTFQVQWQVATDERFRHVVRAGTATARPEYRHSVHVDARGLEPGREYFYRFRSGNHLSPAGRTKTAPERRASALRFGIASCQAYPDGYYTAYRHLAEEDLDVLLFLGDYLYENAVNTVAGDRFDTSADVPDFFQTSPVTLDQYRLFYSLYKADPDLQAGHAALPWIVTWDDHEVVDNYAGAVKGAIPTADFLVQRANAYRAYWEHMPLRTEQLPQGPDARLYRRFDFGDLMQVSVLDTRQYRNAAPSPTITGEEQMNWLLDGLGESRARWNVIANQVMMAEQRTTLTDPPRLNVDAWDGFTEDRRRLFDGIVERGVEGVCVVTGDTHTNYANDLKQNFADPNARTVGVEFVGTSISSGRDGFDTSPQLDLQLQANPNTKFVNGQRGYVTFEVNRDRMRADYRVLPYVTQPGAPVSTRTSFVVERAEPGLKDV